ncbi:MAG TPA: hypothetical protein DCS63_10685 [Elusimicrobia bacterium]|nr:hypothetical protein [Elusimicrobiota bacterium]
MNFFRLRVINTLLFFLTGALIGFILKERFYPARPAGYPERYQPGYTSRPLPDQPAPQIETTVETEEAEEPEPAAEAAPAEKRESAAREPEAAEDDSAATVIEASPREPAAAAPRSPVLRGAQDEFFKRPAAYAGRELEAELQMITAKRSPRGWRLNFVYTAPDKKMDYLYVDDEEILGEAPDLRIGYVYRIRFVCSKGETAAGNSLSLLVYTGKKAAWATGLSAIE